MNNNNTPAILRSLVIYALVVPLAVWMGFLLAAPADRATFSYAGILALILLTPILLRWHHFLLIAGWNLSLSIFFLPGSPPFSMLLTALSLGISVVQRTINSRAHFLSAPELARPLLFFLAVVLMTAKLTGGIGLHSMGSDVGGGKKYFTILFGVMAYFALTAMRIPPKRVAFYVTIYFLAGFSQAVGDLAGYLPSSLHFIFAFLPTSGYDVDWKGDIGFHARYAGLGALGVAGFLLMVARYGLRGILLAGRPWRWMVAGLFFACLMLGGFRSNVIICGMTFAILFYLEGLQRTPLMPLFMMAGLLALVLLIPFADKLPYTFQRSLAFLPLNISQAARLDAESSSGWRLQIWRETYPQVPKYLLLGRGYALTADDLAAANVQSFGGGPRDSHQAEDITGNFHSGPLSVLIPFGAWGTIGLLWLWWAGLRALQNNYRYGDPAFKTINNFLFAYFAVKVVTFILFFGAIEGDLATFAFILGLSVSINGGIRRPAPATRPVAVDKTGVIPLARPRFQPFLPR